MNDEQDRSLYMAEYRSMLKAVITETLTDNNAQVRSIFKEAIKEWLTERFEDKQSLFINAIGVLIIAAMAWFIFNPKR